MHHGHHAYVVKTRHALMGLNYVTYLLIYILLKVYLSMEWTAHSKHSFEMSIIQDYTSLKTLLVKPSRIKTLLKNIAHYPRVPI